MSRTVLRQIGGGAVVNASNWINVRLDQPTTVQTLNPTQLRAESDTNDSYDGTTTAYKAIIKYEEPIEKLKTDNLLFYLGRDGGDDSDATWNLSGYTTLTALYLFTKIQVRPITADFDITTLTWNNFSSLTRATISGATFEGQICHYEGFPSSGSRILNGDSIKISGAIGSGSGQSSANAQLVWTIFANGSAQTRTVYGVTLECKPVAKGWNGFVDSTPTITSCLSKQLLFTSGGNQLIAVKFPNNPN